MDSKRPLTGVVGALAGCGEPCCWLVAVRWHVLRVPKNVGDGLEMKWQREVESLRRVFGRIGSFFASCCRKMTAFVRRTVSQRSVFRRMLALRGT